PPSPWTNYEIRDHRRGESDGGQDRKYQMMAVRQHGDHCECECRDGEDAADHVGERVRGHSQPLLEDRGSQPAYRLLEARVATRRPAKRSRLDQVAVPARELVAVRKPFPSGVERMGWRVAGPHIRIAGAVGAALGQKTVVLCLHLWFQVSPTQAVSKHIRG